MTYPNCSDMFPGEIWAGILSWTMDCRTRLRLELVSRRMNRLAKQHAWSHLHCLQYRALLSDTVDSHKHQVLLDQERLSTPTAESAAQLLQFFWNGRNFIVKNLKCTFQVNETVRQLSDQTSANLELLRVWVESTARCNKRVAVSITYVLKCLHPSFPNFISSLSSYIENIDFSHYCWDGGNLMPSVWQAVGVCRNLKKIRFRHGHHPFPTFGHGGAVEGEEPVEEALKWKGLESLDIHTSPPVLSTAGALRILESLPSPIKHLEIPFLAFQLFPALIDRPHLLTELRTLNLPLGRLKEIVFFCPKLESLKFVHLSPEELSDVAELCLARHEALQQKAKSPFSVILSSWDIRVSVQSRQAFLHAASPRWDRIQLVPGKTKIIKVGENRYNVFPSIICRCFKDQFELQVISSDSKLF